MHEASVPHGLDGVNDNIPTFSATDGEEEGLGPGDSSAELRAEFPATMSRSRGLLRPRVNPAGRAGITQGEHH
ncbi:MAG: hypothetical protein ABW279_07870, partial [Acidimicrobiales bacterium]